MKKGRKLGKLSMEILKSLYKAGPSFIDAFLTMPPDHYQSGAYRVKYRRRYTIQAYNLSKAGYIRSINRKKKGNLSLFRLTPKGRLELLKYLHLEKIFKKKWDGKWRIIIFDIPEDEKKKREYIRRVLKELNFYQLQKSVYIVPFPVKEDLDKILNEKNLRNYFRYVTVSEIDGEEDLKKAFNLS